MCQKRRLCRVVREDAFKRRDRARFANYIDSVTAQTKTLLDRMTDAIHCQMFIGKYGCAVSTAGGSGADEVVAYLNGVLRTLGANTVGGVGVILGGDPETIVPAEGRAYELGRKLVGAIERKETYRSRRGFTPRYSSGCGLWSLQTGTAGTTSTTTGRRPEGYPKVPLKAPHAHGLHR
jgi:hypothetical protein